MEIRACPQPSPAGIIGVARADLDLEGPEATGTIEYWFKARSRDGIERRTPVDAPREIYQSRPKGDD